MNRRQKITQNININEAKYFGKNKGNFEDFWANDSAITSNKRNRNKIIKNIN